MGWLCRAKFREPILKEKTVTPFQLRTGADIAEIIPELSTRSVLLGGEMGERDPKILATHTCEMHVTLQSGEGFLQETEEYGKDSKHRK